MCTRFFFDNIYSLCTPRLNYTIYKKMYLYNLGGEASNPRLLETKNDFTPRRRLYQQLWITYFFLHKENLTTSHFSYFLLSRRPYQHCYLIRKTDFTPTLICYQYQHIY